MRDDGYRLIACPICGWRYPHVHHDLIERYFRAKCENCHAQTEALPSQEKAIEAWNAGKVKVEL